MDIQLVLSHEACQHSDSIGMTAISCPVERSAAHLVLDVDICPQRQKPLDDGCPTGVACPNQRGPAPIVLEVQVQLVRVQELKHPFIARRCNHANQFRPG